MNLLISSDPGPLDALAFIGFEITEGQIAADPEMARQDGWLADVRGSGEFTGKLYETVTLHRPQGIEAKRLIVIGGGKSGAFSPVEARRLAGVLVRSLKSKGLKNVGLSLSGIQATAQLVTAIAEGAVAGAW